MGNSNRHLRGATNEIEVPVHGNTVVEKGEQCFIAQDAVCIVGSATDRYGYPASDLAAVTSSYTEQNFTGVFMKASISGSTENVPVATSGIFRFQINLGTSATAQDVEVGMTVAGATIGASGVSVSGTTVTVGVDSDHDACRIGRCVKAESSATEVDTMIMSRLAGTSMTSS